MEHDQQYLHQSSYGPFADRDKVRLYSTFTSGQREPGQFGCTVTVHGVDYC